jgi:AcrR family transcriptional regulator
MGPSLREQQRGATQARIIDAARDVFGEQGYRAATISQIVERAEIGRATFYRYYADKTRLADDIALSLAPDITAHFLAFADALPTPEGTEQWAGDLVALFRGFGPMTAVLNEALGYNRELARQMVRSFGELSVALHARLAARGPEALTPGAMEALVVSTAQVLVVLFGDNEPDVVEEQRQIRNLAELWALAMVPVPE